MQLRWSEEAASDLERITNYLFEETPQHAPELVRAIYKAPSVLLTFPIAGVLARRRTRGRLFSHCCLTSSSIESPVMLSTFSAFCTAHRNGLNLGFLHIAPKGKMDLA
jgi:plasmid stabilization system protein ParE